MSGKAWWWARLAASTGVAVLVEATDNVLSRYGALWGSVALFAAGFATQVVLDMLRASYGRATRG